MSILRLPRTVYHDLRAHGEEAWPHECCGALLGRAMQEGGPDGWQVDSLVRTLNIRGDSSAGSSLDRYEIAPAELVGIVREASNRGLEIAGFYHSHPGHPAQPSATDLAEAHWIGCSYVITEIAQGKAALTSAFLLAGTAEEDKHFEPQMIQILEPGSDVEPRSDMERA
jgi:proteasome lid subunit RPN8/RPN11